jgi:dihydroorotate dehydrogenase electron transfer subunit
LEQFVCDIVRQVEIVNNIFLMELRAPELASKSRPGNFIHLKVSEGWDPLWRRPFSVHRVSEERKTVSLLYRTIGRGTAKMRTFTSGGTVRLIGPLGNPFDLTGHFDTAVIVSGGLGIAPVHFLADRLAEAGKKIVLLWGVRHSADLFGLEELKRKGVEILSATEDGSAGFHGRATDLLDSILIKISSFKNPRGFACGPMPMFKSMQEIVAKAGFAWQVSLEEKMACGVGVCQGCVVRIRKGEYRTVCADGPVFDLMELDFHG